MKPLAQTTVVGINTLSPGPGGGLVPVALPPMKKVPNPFPGLSIQVSRTVRCGRGGIVQRISTVIEPLGFVTSGVILMPRWGSLKKFGAVNGAATKLPALLNAALANESPAGTCITVTGFRGGR